MKKSWTRYALPGAAILAVAASGCATGRQSAANPTAAGVQTSQRQSEQALENAQQAQEKASEQQQRAAQAQQDVREAQRALQAAQAKAEQEAQKARQAQAAANQATQQATQHAQQSQRQAARQLTQQQQLVERGQQVLSGQVQQASPTQLVVQPPSGEPMTFAVTDTTRVQIDGRRASAGEIRQGQEARVAYDASSAQPTAAIVQVVTGNPAAPRTAAPGATGTEVGTGSGATGTGTGGTSGTAPPERSR